MPQTIPTPLRPETLVFVDTNDGEESFELSDPTQVEGQNIRVLKVDDSGNAANYVYNGTTIATLFRKGEIAHLFATGGAWFGGQPTRDDVIPRILDETGAVALEIQSAGPEPVNYLVLKNAEAGGTPSLVASGEDTNIDISLTPKGTGGVILYLKYIVDFFTNKVMEFVPGGPNCVNNLVATNSITGSPVSLYADGADNDIQLTLRGKNGGGVDLSLPATAGGGPLVISVGAGAPDTSSIADVPTKIVFDAIIQDLTDIGVYV